MNNGLFFIKVVTVLIKTDMALISMNEFLRLDFFFNLYYYILRWLSNMSGN